MRQLQRLSMECLLSWCEDRILADRLHDTSAIAEYFERAWDSAEQGFDQAVHVSEILAFLDKEAKSVMGFIDAVNEGRIVIHGGIIGHANGGYCPAVSG